MTIKIEFDGAPVEYGCHKFSGGEVQPKILNAPTSASDVTITCHAYGSDDIMELLLSIDAVWFWVRRYETGFDGPLPKLKVVLPYLPYARQDRVCAPGESAALEIFLSLLARRGIDHVETWDVHNAAAVCRFMPEDISVYTNHPASEFIPRIPYKFFQPVVIAPDKGALDRATAAANLLGAHVYSAHKIRDAATGKIEGTEIFMEHQVASDLLMVDDICDGGRTFIELAKILRKKTTGRVFLYVTHGIFSQGLDVFHRLIDQIYCPNVFPQVPSFHRLLTRI